MGESTLCALLDERVPDPVVQRDLRNTLRSCNWKIELDSGEIYVEPDSSLVILSKALVCRRFDVGFGSCYSVALAVGGVRSIEHGRVTPVYCFATLWYRLDAELITVDVSATLVP